MFNYIVIIVKLEIVDSVINIVFGVIMLENSVSMLFSIFIDRVVIGMFCLLILVK